MQICKKNSLSLYGCPLLYKLHILGSFRQIKLGSFTCRSHKFSSAVFSSVNVFLPDINVCKTLASSATKQVQKERFGRFSLKRTESFISAHFDINNDSLKVRLVQHVNKLNFIHSRQN